MFSFPGTKWYVSQDLSCLRDTETHLDSAQFPALKDVWDNDGPSPPSTGCLVVGVSRVHLGSGGTLTDAKPARFAPATAPYDSYTLTSESELSTDE